MAKPDPASRTAGSNLKATPAFWKALNALSLEQQALAYKVFPTFKANPFDPSLRPHTINKLSARYRQTVWSVTISGDLRALFIVEHGSIVSIDIGTHEIYR